MFSKAYENCKNIMFHQYLCIIAYYSFNGNLKRSVLHLLLNMLMLLNLLTVDVLTLCRGGEKDWMLWGGWVVNEVYGDT